MYLSELGPTYAALHGADLDRIVGPGYSSGLSSIKELLGDCEETRLPNRSVYFGVFSTSCLVPPALSLDWTWPAWSSVICYLHVKEVMTFPDTMTLSLTGGSY